MSFFTDEERGTLSITNMILHVVGGEKFTNESERMVEHEPFFISRILDTDVGPVYSFNENSPTKSAFEAVEAGKKTFESAAQELSALFSKLHVGSSRDGAFFMFRVTCADSNTTFFSLIKYDYREVIEQSKKGGASLLRRILNAFVADKKAMQKSAIIRVKNGIVEDGISTRDRMKPPPAIGEYFEKFLDVSRSLSDEELNANALEAIRLALTKSKDMLPPGKSMAEAFGEIKGILRGRSQIGEAEMGEALWMVAGSPDDEAIVAELASKLQRELRVARLSGLSFKPNPKIWKKPSLRRVKTVEGITLTYPDRPGFNVERQKKAQGGEVITITTAQVTEDTVVRDSAR